MHAEIDKHCDLNTGPFLSKEKWFGSGVIIFLSCEIRTKTCPPGCSISKNSGNQTHHSMCSVARFANKWAASSQLVCAMAWLALPRLRPHCDSSQTIAWNYKINCQQGNSCKLHQANVAATVVAALKDQKAHPTNWIIILIPRSVEHLISWFRTCQAWRPFVEVRKSDSHGPRKWNVGIWWNLIVFWLMYWK